MYGQSCCDVVDKRAFLHGTVTNDSSIDNDSAYSTSVTLGKGDTACKLHLSSSFFFLFPTPHTSGGYGHTYSKAEGVHHALRRRFPPQYPHTSRTPQSMAVFMLLRDMTGFRY